MNATLIIGILLLILLVMMVGFMISSQNTVVADPHTVDRIEKLLPQTQCRDCGFAGCRPYATAIANRTADINRCLPGGTKTMQALAKSLRVIPKPLYKITDKYTTKRIAKIVENECIGCVKCVTACPVDAIIGAPKQMHSIISNVCTGCELCLPPCPMDCITMVSQ